MVQTHPLLGPYLDRLVDRYGADYIHTDPISEVRRFSNPDDQEVAAFLAAGLAFGRVDTILTHLRDLWSRLDDAPARMVDRWQACESRRLEGFTHRWVNGRDLSLVLAAIRRSRSKTGSLRNMFLAGYDPGDRDLSLSLARFVNAVRSEVRLGRSRSPVPEHQLPRGVRTFFADPARGGACKRLNLFLRWMVRKDDGIDLGLLPSVRTDQLVVPLDTHVSRISRYLGLTTRRTVDWKMALEVTEGLKQIDAEDPVRYDFALSRLGILDSCPRKVERSRCAKCSLVDVCTLGRIHDD